MTAKISMKFNRVSLCGGELDKNRLLSQITCYISKRYKIDAYFLLNLNRKLYALYQMVTLPMTLGDRYILHRFSHLRDGWRYRLHIRYTG